MGRSSELDKFVDAHVAALRAAYRRIRPNRRSMSIEDVEQVVREEFADRKVQVADVAISKYARVLHRRRSWWSWRGVS